MQKTVTYNQPTKSKRTKYPGFYMPLSIDTDIEIQRPVPMSEEEWKEILDTLEFFKPQLVKIKEPEEEVEKEKKKPRIRTLQFLK